ncbi:MAG: carotenoid 1,2-hydratase [Hasllibacter sp.]
MAFIGSVFSPWYRWSGRKDPEDHVCLNVVTYGRGGRWTMTDRGRGALHQEPGRMGIGPSALDWDGRRLTVHVDERTWPHMTRMRGTITLTPEFVTDVELPLTPDGAHLWRPFAPRARARVALGPHGEWEGHAYLDANFGTRALEDDFAYWAWGRFPDGDGALAVYDAERLDGSRLEFAARFAPDGAATVVPMPPRVRLPRTRWALRRDAWADPGHRPRQTRAMLGAPFYNRAAVETVIAGRRTEGVHEALDLRRFRQPLLKPMLAMRVPRRP